MKMAWVQKGFLAARWDGRLQSFSSSDGWCEPKHVQTCWVSRLRSLEKDKTGGSNTGRLKTGGSKVVFAICLWVNIQGLWDPSWGWRGGGGSLPSWQTSCQCTCQPPSWQPPESCASHPAGQSRWQPSSQETGASWAWCGLQNEAKFSEKCWWCLSLEMHKWNGNEGTSLVLGNLFLANMSQTDSMCHLFLGFPALECHVSCLCSDQEFKSSLPIIAVQISSLRKCGLCSKWRHHNIRLDIHKPAWLKWNLGNTRVSQKKLG